MRGAGLLSRLPPAPLALRLMARGVGYWLGVRLLVLAGMALGGQLVLADVVDPLPSPPAVAAVVLLAAWDPWHRGERQLLASCGVGWGGWLAVLLPTVAVVDVAVTGAIRHLTG